MYKEADSMDTRVSTFLDNQAIAGALLKKDALQPRRAAGGIGYAIFTTAFDALRSNRLRSFLTMLGLIIGTSAVIAVVTLTQGVTVSVNQSFSSLGTNVLTISPGASSSRGASGAQGSAQTLTLKDAEAVSQLPGVAYWSPVINASGQVIYLDQNTDTSVRGVYPEYQTIQNLQIAQGAWFTDADEQMAMPVAVIGDTTASNLFTDPTVSPIGQNIRVDAQVFRIVGVLQAKGSQGPGNQDDVIYVPFSAASQRLNPSNYVSQIAIQVDQTSNVTPVQTEITTLLRSRHHLNGPDPALLKQQNDTSSRPVTSFGGGGGGGGFRGGNGGGGGFRGGNGGGGAPPAGGPSGSNTSSSSSASRSSTRNRAFSDPANDFQIFNTDQLIATAQQNSSVLTTLLIGVAAISLTVGGIGIMNIMLVSVTERLREIGICKAIGARERDIRNQFLLEALLLTVAGGMVGIFIGLLVGFLLTLDLHVPFVLSATPVIVAFSVSTIIGVIFGLYPAVRASKLDPILTLRTA
jgi:ABC-type antimicrobial peptide transport system permease subunit